MYATRLCRTGLRAAQTRLTVIRVPRDGETLVVLSCAALAPSHWRELRQPSGLQLELVAAHCLRIVVLGLLLSLLDPQYAERAPRRYWLRSH